MLLLLISTFLIGISTPIAGLLIKDHDPLVFALYFLVSLIIIQLPFVVSRWREMVALFKRKKEMGLLFAGAMNATFLYWSEFSSLKVGLPVSHVTFLSLTVPTWVMFHEYLSGRGRASSLKKVVVAMVGSLILIVPSVGENFTMGHLLPISTSFFMAAFLISSKKSQEAGIAPIVVSFFNDVLALLAIMALIISQDKISLIQMPENVENIFLYAGMIELVPALAFLYGLRTTKVDTASLIMVIEPVIFGVIAIMVNFNQIGLPFLIGAFLITIATLPNFTMSMRKIRVIYAFNMFK